ncbi:Gfo/Idh/MocA family oxidoreductase [Nonomuraea sp. NPDC049158]|uniref:Gfo/Idh/MocA family protein n=1 Tax=Nonomuraea sp. NPDC049158 TaxID=3155649 RepID=UPI0033C7F8E9
MKALRIGVLGAARVAPDALVQPAAGLPEVEVVAVAARDPERARKYARRHGIPAWLPGYQELLDHPDIDAVYIALPNSAHATWTRRALRAGRHVLCEKPFTCNAAEAELIAKEAAESGLVVMEAMHYRYHPLIGRAMELLDEGILGGVERVEAANCFPVPRSDDVVASLALGGGATMMNGCYALHALRLLGGAEPRVVSARATLRRPGVDRSMTADLLFPSGAGGRFACSLGWRPRPAMSIRVTGERGSMRVRGYLMPHVYNRIEVRTGRGAIRERVRGEPSYHYQLRAFADAVLHGGRVATDPGDAAATMRLIDEVYTAAGLPRRGTASEAG